LCASTVQTLEGSHQQEQVDGLTLSGYNLARDSEFRTTDYIEGLLYVCSEHVCLVQIIS